MITVHMLLSGKTEVASPEKLSAHNQSRFRVQQYDRILAPDSIFYSELHGYVVNRRCQIITFDFLTTTYLKLISVFMYFVLQTSVYIGLRAVRERLARRRRIFFGVFPSNGTGKRSRLCTAGWERDGKAGRQKVDGVRWELIISR